MMNDNTNKERKKERGKTLFAKSWSIWVDVWSDASPPIAIVPKITETKSIYLQNQDTNTNSKLRTERTELKDIVRREQETKKQRNKDVFGYPNDDVISFFFVLIEMGWSNLHSAVYNNNIDEVKRFLSLKAYDINELAEVSFLILIVILNDFDWWKCVLMMIWVIGSLSQQWVCWLICWLMNVFCFGDFVRFCEILFYFDCVCVML